MHIKLSKKPKSPKIIIGFPGFGLVGTISSEFLLDHLQVEPIGNIWSEEMQPMLAIHQGKLVKPMGIFYNKKYNLVIFHVIIGSKFMEWKLAKTLVEVAMELKATEIICLEGVGSLQPVEHPSAYYFATHKENEEKLEKAGVKKLTEGIIMGVTASLLVTESSIPITSIFAEAQSQMPDSKASSKIIETLDKYLGLEVDYKPLVKQAEQMETKLKTLINQGKIAEELAQKKQLSYLG